MNADPKDWRKGLYRSRSGMIFGVCKGIANYRDIPVFWVRIFLILLAFFTGFITCILGYIVAALLMKPEPIIPFSSEMDREFYDSYTSSRAMALGRLRNTYENLDRRIGRIETIVTSRDFQWDRRLR